MIYHIYLLNMMIFHSELFNYQKVHISVPSSLGLSSKCCETLAIIKSWLADLMEKTYKKNMVFQCFPVRHHSLAWSHRFLNFLGNLTISHPISHGWYWICPAPAPLCSLSGMILSKARSDGSADRRCDHLAQRQAGWRAAAQLRQKIGWNGMIYELWVKTLYSWLITINRG